MLKSESCICEQLKKVPFGVNVILNTKSGKHLCILLLSADNHCIRGISENELPIILECKDLCGFSIGKSNKKPTCEKIIKEEICHCFKVPSGETRIVWETDIPPLFATIRIDYESGEEKHIKVIYDLDKPSFTVDLHESKSKTVKKITMLEITCPANSGKLKWCKGTYFIQLYFSI